MKQALSHLIGDFLSAILFLVVYLATGSVTIGAPVGIAVGSIQIGYLRLSGRPVEPMRWLSLGLVAVLGGAAMLTQDPRFVMVKPSIAHFAIAAIMLRRGWMLRYLPDVARGNLPDAVPIAAGYAWAGLLAALGLANIAVAVFADFTTWAWFVSVGLLGAKVAAFLLQYAVFRVLVRRRLMAAAAA